MSHRTRILDRMPIPMAELYQQILVDQGLDAEVVGGDLPGIDGWVTVPDDQVPLAEAALAAALPEGKDKQVCPSCGEENPPVFVDCWNCGASLAGDGSDAQDFPESPDDWFPSTAGRLAFLAAVLALVGYLLARWIYYGQVFGS